MCLVSKCAHRTGVERRGGKVFEWFQLIQDVRLNSRERVLRATPKRFPPTLIGWSPDEAPM